MTFCLSGKVTLDLDKKAAKTYLCTQDGTACPFLSKQACHIMNQANMHCTYFLLAYIHAHLNVKADYLSQGRLIPDWCLLPYKAEATFQLWGQLEVDGYVGILTYQLITAL